MNKLNKTESLTIHPGLHPFFLFSVFSFYHMEIEETFNCSAFGKS